MNSNTNTIISTINLPDPKILNRLTKASVICLSLAFIIAATILTAWLMPSIGSALPTGWYKMQATTSLTILLFIISLIIKQKKRTTFPIFASNACTSVALIIMVIALLEHWQGRTAIIGKYLTAASTLSKVHPTSLQSASILLLLGLSLLINVKRRDLLGYINDAFILLLIFLNLMFISGYFFNAFFLVAHSSEILISSQTLICITMLNVVQMIRRAPHGLYSVLISGGIGGYLARVSLPFSIFISYAIVFFNDRLLVIGTLSFPYAAAITATVLATLLVIVIIIFSHKINALSKRIEDLAIIDDLTSIYNRRGFYLHAEQALLDARRSATEITLFLFDLDGLKKVNDTLGHDTGSALIREFAALLRHNFRSNDIVARIGGDEFVALSKETENDSINTLKRLLRTTEARNNTGESSYLIKFSVGKVNVDPLEKASLDQLLARADIKMYRNKLERHAKANITGVIIQQGTPTDAEIQPGRTFPLFRYKCR